MLRALRRTLLSVSVLAIPTAASAQLPTPGYVAPTTPGDPMAFTLRSTFNYFAQQVTFKGMICVNTLNGLADGTTQIPFGLTWTDGGGQLNAQCNIGTLLGAVVQNGQIASSTSFSLNLAPSSGAFGLDFSTQSTGVGFLRFYNGDAFVRSVSRDLAPGSSQFLGAIFWDRDGAFTRVEIGVEGVSSFVVDNLTTAVPEPGTYALLGTGLLAIALAARRRGARPTVSDA